MDNLYNKPFNRWKDDIEVNDIHENSGYQQECVLKAQLFLSIAEGKQNSVQLMQTSFQEQQRDENRRCILLIIETIIFCCRQGLPLRGHRDSGAISLSEEEPLENDGNFRALLRFRVRSGDVTLREHLEKGPRNAQYLSPKIQNEVIFAWNEVILEKLVKMINSVDCFTVLCDETTDISTKEQMRIGVRYIYKNRIREDSLQFEPVTDPAGRNLSQVILSSLQKYGIKTEYLRGQGYDGAGSMSCIPVFPNVATLQA